MLPLRSCNYIIKRVSISQNVTSPLCIFSLYSRFFQFDYALLKYKCNRNPFKPSSKLFLLTVPSQYLLCRSFMCFCLVFVMPLCTSVYLYRVVTYWERAGLLVLVVGVSLQVCHFPIGILGQVWYLIVSIPDLYTLTYFYTLLVAANLSLNLV